MLRSWEHKFFIDLLKYVQIPSSEQGKKRTKNTTKQVMKTEENKKLKERGQKK